MSLGKVPTYIEMRVQVRQDSSFPNDKTVASHFGNMAGLLNALRNLAKLPDCNYLDGILPLDGNSEDILSSKVDDGIVYLLKSGIHFKIGHTSNIERRIKEITVAMPEAITLLHSSKTDDPVGIEAYWHRRFADRRVNGEWFKLKADDLRAFRRRTFQ